MVLQQQISPDEHERLKKESRQLKDKRQKLFNQYLFCVARRGHAHSLHKLLKANTMHVCAKIDCRDEFSHTPVYVAAKRGHLRTVTRLVEEGANLDIRDKNGLTALSICAYLGHPVGSKSAALR